MQITKTQEVESLIKKFPIIETFLQKRDIHDWKGKTIESLCKHNKLLADDFVVQLNLLITRPDRETPFIQQESAKPTNTEPTLTKLTINPFRSLKDILDKYPELERLARKYFGDANFECFNFEVEIKILCEEHGVSLDEFLEECNKVVRLKREPILTDDTLVGDIPRAYPSLVKILNQNNIDIEKNSETSISELCRNQQIPVEPFLSALNEELRKELRLSP